MLWLDLAALVSTPLFCFLIHCLWWTNYVPLIKKKGPFVIDFLNSMQAILYTKHAHIDNVAALNLEHAISFHSVSFVVTDCLFQLADSWVWDELCLSNRLEEIFDRSL